MKKSELQELLRSRGLSVIGNKDNLVNHLLEDDMNQALDEQNDAREQGRTQDST